MVAGFISLMCVFYTLDLQTHTTVVINCCVSVQLA